MLDVEKANHSPTFKGQDLNTKIVKWYLTNFQQKEIQNDKKSTSNSVDSTNIRIRNIT